MTSTLLRTALVGLVLSLVACGGGTDTPDAASPGMDAPVASGSDTDPSPDAVASPDAFSADDAPSAVLDAPSSVDPDAVVIETDAGFEGDAGNVGAGECETTVECPPTCFRAITCVKVCGGPETECGCCACAPGSIDAITCGTTD